MLPLASLCTVILYCASRITVHCTSIFRHSAVHCNSLLHLRQHRVALPFIEQHMTFKDQSILSTRYIAKQPVPQSRVPTFSRLGEARGFSTHPAITNSFGIQGGHSILTWIYDVQSHCTMPQHLNNAQCCQPKGRSEFGKSKSTHFKLSSLMHCAMCTQSQDC